MSLAIDLTNKDGEPVADMNWLRNPFGLRDWAEDTYQLATGQGEREIDLWYVINHWNYDKSAEVDRPLFKRVVDEYWRGIEPLTEGYFFFTVAGYIQFVEPHLHLLPTEMRIPGAPEFGRKIAGSKYVGHKIAIPIEHFRSPAFNLASPSLDKYKAWFAELVRFAELLQDPGNVFFCSN